ncbi:hypothetical protein C7M84_011870 [Penaeus vannamei]|uniref:Reverse transcriptase domain-containing protein n=1 Tax=Penaeus vannamei TaxID=6689 RepID=A0A423T0B1_PENVA|nr:hypothetical protein C7M84_011870 [Penaeus vannamei]
MLRSPAKDSECTSCHKWSHFARCCKSIGKTSTTQRACRVSRGRTPQPVNVTLSYGSKSSHLLMLPDTGAYITVIYLKHPDALGIPRCSLLPPPPTDVLTADGSSMTPALRRFEITLQLGRAITPGSTPFFPPTQRASSDRWLTTTAITTLQLGQASCKAIVHVHECIQTPLLSYGHCVDLAIISTDFPKPIISVTHVNRCVQQMPSSAMSSPTPARTYFLQYMLSKTDLQTMPLKMSGPPMRFHLQPSATSFAIHTPRPRPFAYQDQVKEELDSPVQQGIISLVSDKPSEWCHPMVLVPKPGNGERITVDLTRLNSLVSRPTHPSPTPADAICTITPSAMFFTKVDALHGYWQMDLVEEERHLTRFITPHCRGPMGFAATGDAYCLRRNLDLQGITNCVKVVDDILLFDNDLPTHLRRVFQMLSRSRAHGITLNKDKFMVVTTKVSFCGHDISPEGIAVDPEKLADFPPEIAATAQPFCPLMSLKWSFTWTPDHDQAFGKVKATLLLGSFQPETAKLTPLASMVWDTPYYRKTANSSSSSVAHGFYAE